MDVEYILLIIAGITTAAFIIKVLIFAFTNDSRSLISSYQLVSVDSIMAFVAGLSWVALVGIALFELPIFMGIILGVVGGFVCMPVAALLLYLTK